MMSSRTPDEALAPVSPDPDLSDGERPALKPGHVWLTRRRLGLYCLAGTLAVGAVAAGEWWYFREPRFVFPTLLFPVLWLGLLWSLPREGVPVPTIRGKPGLIPLMKWLVAWGLVGIVMIEGFSRGGFIPPEGQPWSVGRAAIVVIAFVAWFAVLLLGGHQVECRYVKKRSLPDDSMLD